MSPTCTICHQPIDQECQWYTVLPLDKARGHQEELPGVERMAHWNCWRPDAVIADEPVTGGLLEIPAR